MRFRIFERTSNIQHRTLNVELRSEEHTSELQSRLHLVCRLLLEKKKKTTRNSKPDPLTTYRPRKDCTMAPATPLQQALSTDLSSPLVSSTVQCHTYTGAYFSD